MRTLRRRETSPYAAVVAVSNSTSAIRTIHDACIWKSLRLLGRCVCGRAAGVRDGALRMRAGWVRGFEFIPSSHGGRSVRMTAPARTPYM